MKLLVAINYATIFLLEFYILKLVLCKSNTS